jgi:hypothetical protein
LSKLQVAEETAVKLLLPRVHSNGPEEDGEPVPVWLEIFCKYFEVKKSVVLKTVQHDQECTVLWTMRNNLLPFTTRHAHFCST